MERRQEYNIFLTHYPLFEILVFSIGAQNIYFIGRSGWLECSIPCISNSLTKMVYCDEALRRHDHDRTTFTWKNRVLGLWRTIIDNQSIRQL